MGSQGKRQFVLPATASKEPERIATERRATGKQKRHESLVDLVLSTASTVCCAGRQGLSTKRDSRDVHRQRTPQHPALSSLHSPHNHIPVPCALILRRSPDIPRPLSPNSRAVSLYVALQQMQGGEYFGCCAVRHAAHLETSHTPSRLTDELVFCSVHTMFLTSNGGETNAPSLLSQCHSYE